MDPFELCHPRRLPLTLCVDRVVVDGTLRNPCKISQRRVGSGSCGRSEASFLTLGAVETAAAAAKPSRALKVMKEVSLMLFR